MFAVNVIVNVHFFHKWGNAFSAMNLSSVFIHVDLVKIWKHQRQVCVRRGSLYRVIKRGVKTLYYIFITFAFQALHPGGRGGGEKKT